MRLTALSLASRAGFGFANAESMFAESAIPLYPAFAALATMFETNSTSASVPKFRAM